MTPSLETPPAELPEDPAEATQNDIPDYGPDNRDLPKQIVNLFRQTIVEFQGQEKTTRRREVRCDRKLRYYEAGYQFLQWWNQSAGFSLLVPGGTAYNASGGSMQCPTYMDVYNIFLRFFLIVQSVLTQSLPAVRWMPLDPDNPDDIDKNKEAQNYAKLYDRRNDTKELVAQVARMLGMSGRTVSWTRTEQDAQRFGYEADGVTPKRFEMTEIFGTLETKVPMTCREFDRTAPYLFIYKDADICITRDDYPWVADQIKAGAAALEENEYERYARLGVLNGSRGTVQIGDALNHIATTGHFFLRPAAYQTKAYDVPMEDGSGTVKDEAMRLYPNGARFVFSGNTYVGSYAECPDDHLSVIWPNQGDSMFRPGFMGACSMDTVNDHFNDLMNWIREKVDTGAGETYVAGEEDEIDAIVNRRAAPNATIPAKGIKLPGEPLSAFFYKTPDPDIPEALFKILEMLRDLGEFLLSALPSIQGAEQPGNDTASGFAMAAANAKSQLNILYSRMQRMWARIRYQSAVCASQCEQQGLVVNVPATDSDDMITVDYDVLKKGSFGCYPDEDAGFPETTSQKRSILSQWTQLAGQSPMVAELLDNPDNIEQFKELNGFADLVFIPAEARTKQMFEIKALLASAPVPPDPIQMQAMQEAHAAASISNPETGPFVPPQPQPSVPIQELDFHQFELAKCQEWLSSKQRRDYERKNKPDPMSPLAAQLGSPYPGIQNVILHALAHQAKIAQAMAAQAAAAPPTPDKGKPSPPSDKRPTPGTQNPPGA